MPWEPALEELLPAERALLARLGPVGLDGLTSRETLAARHGIGSYHGWREAIALPVTAALGLPLAFWVSAEQDVRDLVPEHAWADHLPVPDARENFAEVLAALEGVIGPGQRVDVANCLQAHWPHGMFVITLRAFPPELQGPAPNTLHALAPQLAHRATVTCSAPGAFVIPDGSLRAVGDLAPIGLGVSPAWSATSWPRRYGRRNPRALAEAVSGVAAWRHAGRAGLSAPDVSLVFPDDPRARVVAVHGTEERSDRPYSEVERRGDRVERLLVGSSRDAASRAARTLARVWDLPVSEEDRS